MEKGQNIYSRLFAGMLFLVAVMGAAGMLTAAPDNSEQGAGEDSFKPIAEAGTEIPDEAVAAIITCEGMIDNGLLQSIKRRTQEALDMGATHLIYEIDTYGGLVISADQISEYLILDAGKKAHTVAYITTKAISAGAMISVACKDIIMREHTTIGDCAPITMGGELKDVEREKAESFIRATFSRAAQANGYPEPLLKAMVSQMIEVYRVKNIKTGEFEFFETADLPKDPNTYALDDKEEIVSDKEILTLTAKDAKKYGIAREVVTDLDEALAFIEERDGIEFSREPIRLKMLWSEQMVRWINSPAVMGVLVLLAMLGAYIELNTPGLGLPGLVALICVIIIIGSKYLVGLANWVEVAIFAIGIGFLLVELFVIPGFGITGFIGIVCIFVGLFGMLVRNAPDEIPWPKSEFDWMLFTQGVFALMAGVTGFGVIAWLFARFIPKVEFLSGLILSPSRTGAESKRAISATSIPQAEMTNVEVGMKGVVISPLRPCGSVKFGETIADVTAEAQFLENGQAVEIIEIHGNRVTVKAINELS